MSSFTFNPSKYGADKREDKPSQEFKPLPEGWYPARVKDCTTKMWPDGGFSIQMTWEVTGGSHKKRLIWQTLNLKHKNPARVLKAKYMLSDICTAVGQTDPISLGSGEAPTELVNKEAEIELILLPPQLPTYPKPKNYLRAVRMLAPEPTEVPSSVPEAQTFHDDDIPF